jgi:hypothetical protein
MMNEPRTKEMKGTIHFLCECPQTGLPAMEKFAFKFKGTGFSVYLLSRILGDGLVFWLRLCTLQRAVRASFDCLL